MSESDMYNIVCTGLSDKHRHYGEITTQWPLKTNIELSFNESQIFTNDIIDDASNQRDAFGSIFPSRNGGNDTITYWFCVHYFYYCFFYEHLIKRVIIYLPFNHTDTHSEQFKIINLCVQTVFFRTKPMHTRTCLSICMKRFVCCAFKTEKATTTTHPLR